MKTKFLTSVLYTFLVGLTIISCSIEDNLDEEGKWTLSEPIINVPSANAVVVLNELTPNETVTFEWERAVSSAGFGVTYEVVIDTTGTTDFSNPILAIRSGNQGKDNFLAITHSTIDLALAQSGFPANSEATVAYAVRATSLSKTSIATSTLKFFRFATETKPSQLFISGTATENNGSLSQAIAMRRLNNSSSSSSNVYEVYTRLEDGGTFKFFSERGLPAFQFGGANGAVVPFGEAITVSQAGEYRVQIDLDANTYDLLKIDFWSMVGSPISGGWGGDEPLVYQSGGIWKASINLVGTGGFAFRANGDWAYLLKRVVGSQNNLVMESQAPAQGLTVQDIPSNSLGRFFVTLDLSANQYTYTFEEDTTVVAPIATPQQLFLFENGMQIAEFSKNGDVFSITDFVPMQAGRNYTLNSSSNGLGTTYSINGRLANSNTPNADTVLGTLSLVASNASFTLDSDRGLRLTVDFSMPELKWQYYNFKLFHWQVWDTRSEFLMTYEHPNTYKITTPLVAGNDSKFISPWDFEMGTTSSPAANSGNLVNGGGANLLNITTNDTYQVTMVLQDDYQTATYTFTR